MMKVHLLDFASVFVADAPVFQYFLQHIDQLLELEKKLPNLGLQVKSVSSADGVMQQQIFESRTQKIRVQFFSNRLSVEENILTMKGGKAFTSKFLTAFFENFGNMPVSALGLNFNGFVDFTSKEDHLKYCEENLLSNTLLLQAETFIPDASKSLSGAEISAIFIYQTAAF